MKDFHRQIEALKGLRSFDGWSPYLTHAEMLMNTEAGIVLQRDGIQRIGIHS
jgi:hypothetical protein